MGWNDHVEFVQMECQACGDINVWEFWDEIAVARYGNDLGRKLGHDFKQNGRCPNCGSSMGREINDD